jgi:hypothetical protein
MHCISKGHWRHHSFDVRRGSYVGTSDDRADGWYLDHVDATILDRRGAGLPTLADCRARVDDLNDDLHCPHCLTWIGDPSDPGISHLSVDHDISECGKREDAADLLELCRGRSS